METEKRSFFREYFFYKLRSMLAIGIISAVMSFLACIITGICFLAISKANDFGVIEVTVYGLLGSLAGFAGLMVLAIITPIISFKFYRQRNFTDTLGCLPVTYGQRFWGDFLSGLAAIVLPFCVMSGIGGIMFAAAQKAAENSSYGEDIFYEISGDKDVALVTVGLQVFVIWLIVIVATYAVAALVTSCCGKAGSSALYTVIALPIIPAIISLYGLFALNYTVGIIPEKNIVKVLSCFPPIGTIISVYMGMRNGYFSQGLSQVIKPLPLAISVIFIAVIIVAAYLIGKRRKAERVGESFVVNTMYHALALLLVVAVIGIYVSANNSIGLDVSKIIIGAIIALIFYLILEFVQNRSFKTIWKSLIRYACVAVLGFGFFGVVWKTECFGVWKNLPKQGDILEVSVNGGYFYGYGKDYTYRAEDAVSAILSEHQRLLENTDKIFTGEEYAYNDSLNIKYRLKNGSEISRYYRGDKELIESVSREIIKQPAYSMEALGFLNDPFYEGVQVTFNISNSWEDKVLKRSVYEELFSVLKDDLINHYIGFGEHTDIFGGVLISYPDEHGDTQRSYYYIANDYTKTVEILSNPDNFADKTEDSNAYYEYHLRISIYDSEDDEATVGSINSLTVSFSSDSDSEYAKELISYFEDKVSDDLLGGAISFVVTAYDEDGIFRLMSVREDKRNDALKAALNFIAEQMETADNEGGN